MGVCFLCVCLSQTMHNNDEPSRCGVCLFEQFSFHRAGAGVITAEASVNICQDAELQSLNQQLHKMAASVLSSVPASADLHCSLPPAASPAPGSES